MDFYLTVDCQNCRTFDRARATITIDLPTSINFRGQWVVALTQYGLNNGIFLLEGRLHNHACITSKLVVPQMVGDKMHRVLTLVPLDFVSTVPDMEFFFREVWMPAYIPVDSTSQSSITVEFRDSKFQLMTFRGKTEVILQLHFKCVSGDT